MAFGVYHRLVLSRLSNPVMDGIVAKFKGPYEFIPNEYYSQGVILGVLIVGVIISLWVAVYAKRIRIFTPEIILFSAFVSVALVPFLLPKMHDRYFYPADVLSLLAVFYFPRLWFLALGYQIISAMAYYVFLVLPPFDPFGITVLSVAALIHPVILGLAAGTQWHIISQGNPNPGQMQKTIHIRTPSKIQ